MGNGRWNIFYALLCLFWQTNISYYKTKLKVNTVNKPSYHWLISNTNKKYWFAFIWHPCICNCQVSIHQVTACFLGMSLSVICLPLPSGSWSTWSLEWDRPDTTSASSRINSAQWRLDSICIHPHTLWRDSRKEGKHSPTHKHSHTYNKYTHIQNAQWVTANSHPRQYNPCSLKTLWGRQGWSRTRTGTNLLKIWNWVKEAFFMGVFTWCKATAADLDNV